MTAVMMFGGRRDGEILEVPGGVEPESKKIKFTMRKKFDPFGDFDLMENIEKDVIILDIVPRKAKFGPRWKIDLPKELW